MAYFESKKLPPISTPTVTGAICTFNSQYAGLPLKSHVVDVDYTGSTISGVHIQNTCGINQCDEQWRTGYYSGTNGTYNPQNNTICSLGRFRCTPNTEYYIYSGSLNINVMFYDDNNNFISYYYHGNGKAITTPNNCYWLRWTADFGSGNTYNNDISINYPSTDTSYHAFEGQSFNITFDTPIYGGSYDCLTGIVTSNKDSGGGDITPTYQQTATANCVTNLGENNIWADTGDTTIQYIKLG